MKTILFLRRNPCTLLRNVLMALSLATLLLLPCMGRKKTRKLADGGPISCDLSTTDFDNKLKSGSMDGYFTYKEFWKLWRQLKHSYPNFISKEVEIGKSYKGKTMTGFYFGDNVQEGAPKHKERNIVLITALHHAREPLTLTMVIYMMVKILQERGICGYAESHKANMWKLFFRNNIFFFIPFVNPDSYIFISKNGKGPDGDEVRMIRKNRHIDNQCTIYTGGVDLNRNYDFMFGKDEKGSSSNPCEEDYRGAHAFSEPETQAIRHYVEGHSNIVTGINMHTYGNAWVYPFNFVHDATNELLEERKPKFYSFYHEFIRDMKRMKEDTVFGNAQKTVQYPTNGEAGDWMTGKHNILNLDVELGNTDKESDKFYPAKHLIPQICQFNFRVFRQFFWRHNVNLVLHQVRRNSTHKKYTFFLFNKSISSLYNFSATVLPRMKKPMKHRHFQRGLSSKKRRRRRKKNMKRNRKRTRKRGSWHTVNYKKFTKSTKMRNRRTHPRMKPRFLNTNDYEIYYKIISTCPTNADGTSNNDFNYHGGDLLQKHCHLAKNNTISGTLRGRYYLMLQIKFNSLTDMDKMEALDLQLNYANNYTKTYEFYPRGKKRKVLEERRLNLVDNKDASGRKHLD